MNQMSLPPGQERFRLEHEILAKRELMESLVSRHNYLSSQLPKEIVSDDVASTFQLTLAEIDANMKQLQAVMAELESDCERSPFFRKQTTTEMNKSDASA
jgi:hypothetical protein